jgi:hypothetical protein
LLQVAKESIVREGGGGEEPSDDHIPAMRVLYERASPVFQVSTVFSSSNSVPLNTIKGVPVRVFKLPCYAFHAIFCAIKREFSQSGSLTKYAFI